MLVGAGVVTWWDQSAWAGDLFKLLPGMIAPLATYALIRFFQGEADTRSTAVD